LFITERFCFSFNYEVYLCLIHRFQSLKIHHNSMPSFLLVSVAKYSVILMGLLLYVAFHFSLAAFNILSLFCRFNVLAIICCLLGILIASFIYVSSLIHDLGNFLLLYYWIHFLAFTSFPFSMPMIWRFCLLGISQWSCKFQS
jgi:hypothetical protein